MGAIKRQHAGNGGISAGRVGLLVSADTGTRALVSRALAPADADILCVTDSTEALQRAEQDEVGVVVINVSDPRVKGLQLLRALVINRQSVMAVAVADSGDYEVALRAARMGAYQCLLRPFADQDLACALEGAMTEWNERGCSVQKYRQLTFAHPGKRIIGNGRAMRETFRRVDLVRRVNTNVVIRGETGTGKELIARAIHNNSTRRNGPFVKLNCGAIPKDLLESELFGHEKGSFTGAMQRRIGRFEMADGGTILLDEIGDMPLELQVKLLSVIQDRAVQRVGGHDRIPVDVRIIAATHQDLEQAIEQNRFRQDLYYRLNVVTIRVPTLRERREDIPPLAHHFLQTFVRITGKPVAGFDEDALRLLCDYDYPGNVRELQNIIESAVVFCQDGVITPADLPRVVRNVVGRPVREVRIAAGTPLEEVERLCIIETLKHTEGNKRRAAALLGISEKSVYNKLDRYNISLDGLDSMPASESVLSSAPDRYERV